MLRGLRVAHLQYRRKLQQCSFCVHCVTADGGQALGVDMQPAPDPARGLELPGLRAHGDLPSIVCQLPGAQGAFIFQLGEDLRHHVAVHFLPVHVHSPTSLKKR